MGERQGPRSRVVESLRGWLLSDMRMSKGSRTDAGIAVLYRLGPPDTTHLVT